MVKYAEIIKKSLHFCVSPKRWVPIFALDLIIFSIFIIFALSNVGFLQSLVGTPNPATIMTMIGLFVGAFALMVVWVLTRLWVTGAVIHQSYKPKEFHKSWGIACRKYPAMFGATVIVVIISIVLGIIPLVGSLLSAIASVIFFFFLQSVIVGRKGITGSLHESWYIFFKNLAKFKMTTKDKNFRLFLVIEVIITALFAIAGFFMPSMLFIAALIGGWVMLLIMVHLLVYSRVFRIWLVLVIISGLIASIFAIPGIMIFVGTFLPSLITAGMTGTIPPILPTIMANTFMLFVAGLIFLIGIALSTVFSLKAQTEFYLQLRKKKFGIF
jgi:uncharacterized membrane protein (DUF485 family)